ncbi:hypothetical protein B0H13DRAFT_2310180 [Mycena leptocephala]|nr:hypothetical protein B0H13DRAFT_2310180 [Mycena leptocephala]
MADVILLESSVPFDAAEWISVRKLYKDIPIEVSDARNIPVDLQATFSSRAIPALAHAAHHIVTERYVQDQVAQDEAELEAIDRQLDAEPETPIPGRLAIANLLNPAPSKIFSPPTIPTFVNSDGTPILRQVLVEQGAFRANSKTWIEGGSSTKRRFKERYGAPEGSLTSLILNAVGLLLSSRSDSVHSLLCVPPFDSTSARFLVSTDMACGYINRSHRNGGTQHQYLAAHSPSESRFSSLALFTHAPISEFVYLLAGTMGGNVGRHSPLEPSIGCLDVPGFDGDSDDEDEEGIWKTELSHIGSSDAQIQLQKVLT